MTSFTYEYEAEVRDGATWSSLPVMNIVPSADLDRVPYAAAMITTGPLTGEQWSLLDPRTVDPIVGGQVRWRVRQLDASGSVLGYLPRVGETTDDWATMWVRNVSRSLGVTTITVGGGETMIDDRIVLEATGRLGSNYETSRALASATSLGGYVDAVLSITFGAGHASPLDDTATAALQLGSRRRLDPTAAPSIPYADLPAPTGSSFMQLIETELSSVGCRLVDAWGLGWFVTDRNHGPSFEGGPSALRWASYPAATPGVVDIITDFTETVTRDGDWADTIVVTGELNDLDETRSWRHAAETGTKSRGRIIAIESAEPSGNLAASIASRTFRRGHDITVTTAIVLDAVPGVPVEIHLRSGVLTGELVSVEWDTDRGEMTSHIRSAIDVPVSGEARGVSTRISAEAALAQAQRFSERAVAAAAEDAERAARQRAEAERRVAARGYDGGF